MAEKYLKSRIVHKHDTAENWLKATTFVPLKGELVVYDIDNEYSYERFKIGDGKTLVNDLPFADEALKDFISNTYVTKTELNNSLFKTKTVGSLPTEGETNTLYLVKSQNGTEGDKYEEYLYIKNSGGTPVPNDGTFVENIYFNTSLSIDEVKEICSQIAEWVDTGDAYLSFIAANDTGESALVVATFEEDVVIMGTVGGSEMIAFQTAPLLDEFVGWNPDIISMPFNSNAGDGSELGLPIGSENDKLTNLFSITEFGAGTRIPGTPVKTGINKVYFDTTKSVDEVDAALSQLTNWARTGEPNNEERCIIGTDGQYKLLGVFRYSTFEGYSIGIMDYATWSVTPIYSTREGGWLIANDSLDLGFTTTSLIVDDVMAGAENSLISDIVSATPFIAGGTWEQIGGNNAVESGASSKYTTISLPVSGWVGSTAPYSQVVTIAGATANSKIDLQPTIEQLSDMLTYGLSMQAVNEDGVVTVYVIGGKPQSSYTMQVLITETEVA